MASPTISNKGTKAASSVNQGQNTAGRNGTAVKRGIIVHPERQKLNEEKARKLALLIQEEAKLQASKVDIYAQRAAKLRELERFIKGG